MFKPVPEPPALDHYLINCQVANYCDALATTTAQGMAKLDLMQGLQHATAAAAGGSGGGGAGGA